MSKNNIAQFLVFSLVYQISIVLSVKFELGPCLLQYLEPCTDDVIQFYVFSSDQPVNSAPYLMDMNNSSMSSSAAAHLPSWIDFRNKINKVIVHGYGGNLDFHATKTIRNAYLTRPNTNVIIVDWGKLAKLPCYPTAVFNTKQAGECVGTFLLNISYMFGSNFQKLHLIGFSLGAHVVSFASNIVYDATGVSFDRITGLDPALPFFTTVDHKWKLDQSDAKFVDIIHTNAGVFGKIEPSGHVDFYINGGQIQQACSNHSNIPLCSHMMATVYFAESINSEVGFWGARCTSYFQYLFGFCVPPTEPKPSTRFLRHLPLTKRIRMGEHCLKISKGIVFINTHERPPYALG